MYILIFGYKDKYNILSITLGAVVDHGQGEVKLVRVEIGGGAYRVKAGL